MTPDELLARLAALGLPHTNHVHEAVYTVEESQRLRGVIPGGHLKNLFVRDKKRRYWLLTVLEERAVDLKGLRGRLGASGSLSLASPDRLAEVLGLEPGTVTPFGVVNDDGGRVTVVLDEGLFAHDLVGCHPLTNEATTTLAPADLVRFLEATGHRPIRLDFDGPDPAVIDD